MKLEEEQEFKSAKKEKVLIPARMSNKMTVLAGIFVFKMTIITSPKFQ